jgi:hypothetical protein
MNARSVFEWFEERVLVRLLVRAAAVRNDCQTSCFMYATITGREKKKEAHSKNEQESK